jgi:hypothetical protein
MKQKTDLAIQQIIEFGKMFKAFTPRGIESDFTTVVM